jgi:uncharacterized protein YabE (DUF348 family)
MRFFSDCWQNRRSRCFMITGAAAAVAVVITIAYFCALHQVSLTVDGQNFQWQSMSQTVADVLHEKQVVLGQGDVVKPDPGTPVNQNMAIEVWRAFPVEIKTAQASIPFHSIAQPVRDVLAKAQISYSTEDRIWPGLDTVVHANQVIRVVRVKSEIVTKQVVLNPAVEYQKDLRLERGEQKVLRTGTPGLAERRVKITYEDGWETGVVTLAERILKPALDTVIALGIKPVVRTLETSRGSYRYLELKLMDATAYYPGPESCGIYAINGRTFLGKKAGFGLVAVDPRVIPLGTKLYIEGYGPAEAADKGSAIKGNRIDLCFETYREAEMFGRRPVKVYILEQQ